MTETEKNRTLCIDILAELEKSIEDTCFNLNSQRRLCKVQKILNGIDKHYDCAVSKFDAEGKQDVGNSILI